jgi:Protein of unknown function (DUF3311)
VIGNAGRAKISAPLDVASECRLSAPDLSGSVGEATPHAAAQIRRGRAILDNLREARRDFRPTGRYAPDEGGFYTLHRLYREVGQQVTIATASQARRRSNLDSRPKTHIIRVQQAVCLGQTCPSMDNKKRKPSSNWWYLLLLVQFVGTLWVPFYNSAGPNWAGIPFFYWYQMLMVFVGAGITAIVYFATE